MKTLRVVAHRGDVQHHTENTLTAIQASIDSGVYLVECDVQINGAGTPVLLHDTSLQRVYQREESIFETTPLLDRLDDLLIMVANQPANQPQVRLFLEIKHDSIDHWGEEFVAQQLHMTLTPCHAHHVVLARSISFLKKMRKLGHPNIACNVRDTSRETYNRLLELAPDYLVIRDQRIDKAEGLWPGPWQWLVYEVSTLEQGLTLQQLGATHLISFNSSQLQQQLNEQQESRPTGNA